MGDVGAVEHWGVRGWLAPKASAEAKVSALTTAFSSRFWGLLADYLPTHSICMLPLATSFSLGMGTSRFLTGKVGVGPWLGSSW